MTNAGGRQAAVARRVWPAKCGEWYSISSTKGFAVMWKPTNPPSPSPNPSADPQRPAPPAVNLSPEPTPVSAPRNATVNNQEQATIGKSLVIKGEVSGSESLYIDGRVEGSINLSGNRVTI